MQELHRRIEQCERLFTIFCRHNEAVCVSQFAAKNVSDAVNAWITRELPSLGIPGEQMAGIGRELRSDSPGLVQGCVNVWVVTAFPVWLDIVATSDESER